MILNINITGKETKEQLAHMAADITLEFQNEASFCRDGKALENTWIVFSMLASNLNAAYAVNLAMNTVKDRGNREEVETKVTEVMGDLDNLGKDLTTEFMNQIFTGKAPLTELPNGK